MDSSKLRNKILFLLFICIALIGIDQWTKELARDYLKDKESYSYLGDVFRLEYAENTGAFLSLGDDLSNSLSFWLLSMIPLLVLLGLLFYIIRHARTMSRLQSLALTFIFSGGIGNIIDRILYDRHVTDFMNMGIGNLRTGIFNFADLYLSAGVIMMLFTYSSKAPGEVKST